MISKIPGINIPIDDSNIPILKNLELQNQPLVSTPVEGLIEYNGSQLWFTIGNNRIQISNPSAVVGGISGPSTKTIANNTTTGIFTFPLSIGESLGLTLSITETAKKGADWAVASILVPIAFYNDNGTLHMSVVNNGLILAAGSLSDEDINNAGAVSVVDFRNPTGVLNAGIVTVSVNPGNVGTSPDSIVINYVIINPSNKVITFL